MILNFKTKMPDGTPSKFKEKILAGTKIHTMREFKPSHTEFRWKAGREIHFSTGSRTKHYNCFAKGTVTKTKLVKIDDFNKHVSIYNDDVEVLLNESEIETLAKNDGFDSIEMFWKWFSRPKPTLHCSTKFYLLIHFSLNV